MKTFQYNQQPHSSQLTGEDIRRARNTAKVSKQTLATWLNISRPTLDNLERGGPTRSGLPSRALTALQERGPVPKPEPIARQAKAGRCPPDRLVLLLALADELAPRHESVNAVLRTVESLLGMPVDGPSLKEIPNSAKLFDVRVAAIAAKNPRWLQEVLEWLTGNADSGIHPLFEKAATDVCNAMYAIQRGESASRAFGNTTRGRPHGKIKAGVYHTKQFTQKEDAIRLVHLLVQSGTPRDIAVGQAAAVCLGSEKMVPVLQREFKKASRENYPLLQYFISDCCDSAAGELPMAEPGSRTTSPVEIGVEISAIKYKYRKT